MPSVAEITLGFTGRRMSAMPATVVPPMVLFAEVTSTPTPMLAVRILPGVADPDVTTGDLIPAAEEIDAVAVEVLDRQVDDFMFVARIERPGPAASNGLPPRMATTGAGRRSLKPGAEVPSIVTCCVIAGSGDHRRDRPGDGEIDRIPGRRRGVQRQDLAPQRPVARDRESAACPPAMSPCTPSSAAAPRIARNPARERWPGLRDRPRTPGTRLVFIGQLSGVGRGSDRQSDRPNHPRDGEICGKYAGYRRQSTSTDPLVKKPRVDPSATNAIGSDDWILQRVGDCKQACSRGRDRFPEREGAEGFGTAPRRAIFVPGWRTPIGFVKAWLDDC